jgi:MFS family permease
VARRLALVVLLGAVAVAFADSSIVVLALPDLLRQFDVSITSVAWVVSAYNVALAVVALAYTRIRPSRFPAARAAGLGSLVFFIASLGCAVASSLWVLVGFRSVQGGAAAVLLVGSLPLVRKLASTPDRGTALWAGAGVFGAALGPALGGALTEIFGWQAIFVATAPVAGFACLAALGVRGQTVDLPALQRRSGRRRHAASVALALASAALVGLLFLAVVELIDVWRLSPLQAAAVVSVIPLATLLAQPLAIRIEGAAPTAGAILIAAGLAGMGFLPARSLLLVATTLAIAGAGLGLLLPGLTRRVLTDAGPSTAGAAHTVWIRHAGLVAGILLLTPLLATDLAAAGENAKLRGISVVLNAPVSITTKARLALDLAPVLSEPTRNETAVAALRAAIPRPARLCVLPTLPRAPCPLRVRRTNLVVAPSRQRHAPSRSPRWGGAVGISNSDIPPIGSAARDPSGARGRPAGRPRSACAGCGGFGVGRERPPEARGEHASPGCGLGGRLGGRGPRRATGAPASRTGPTTRCRIGRDRAARRRVRGAGKPAR